MVIKFIFVIIMPWRHHTSGELSQLLGISEEDFHRRIKKIIKRDFKVELENLEIRNPDILLDNNQMIALADPRDHNNFYVTNLELNSYI